MNKEDYTTVEKFADTVNACNNDVTKEETSAEKTICDLLQKNNVESDDYLRQISVILPLYEEYLGNLQLSIKNYMYNKTEFLKKKMSSDYLRYISVMDSLEKPIILLTQDCFSDYLEELPEEVVDSEKVLDIEDIPSLTDGEKEGYLNVSFARLKQFCGVIKECTAYADKKGYMSRLGVIPAMFFHYESNIDFIVNYL